MAKVVFMGSPAFAVPSLQALVAEEHEIVAVYTQPPRPAGRGQKLQKTAVHVLAEELGLAVFHPEKLRGAELEKVLAIEADVLCVVAYGLLLPKALVDSRLCLNVHPSALPRWRGAAPLQWTLMAGDTTTDVCVMLLDEGMDTGPVISRQAMAVDGDWDLGYLHDITADTGAMMLAEVVEKIGEQTARVSVDEKMFPEVLRARLVKGLRAMAQVGTATHAGKISGEMRAIDWSKSAAEVRNLVRGLSPAPGATAKLGDDIFKVLRVVPVERWTHKVIDEAGTILGVDAQGVMVACGTGAVRIEEMQRAGGKPGFASEIARGWSAVKAGAKLEVASA